MIQPNLQAFDDFVNSQHKKPPFDLDEYFEWYQVDRNKKLELELYDLQVRYDKLAKQYELLTHLPDPNVWDGI